MKKVFAFLVAAALLCSFAMPVFAVDGATFTVSNAVGQPGDTVTVAVAFKNNPGIVGAQLDLQFDTEALSVVSCKGKDSRFTYPSYDVSDLVGASKVTLVMVNLSMSNVADGISIAEVGFKIADTAADGVYEITVANASAYRADISNADQPFPDVAVTAGKGTVTVSTSKFAATRTYANEFTDVAENQWFYSYVKTAYEYALANGTSANKFSPDGTFTVAQALTAAVNIHKAYNGTTVRTAASGEAWYTPYVEYCVEKGIITANQFADYNKNITRGEMAIVFANILPESEYIAIRDKVLPDLTDDMACAAAVKLLANAGIVGGDTKGNYNADNDITRAEACVIFTRIAVASMRDGK